MRQYIKRHLFILYFRKLAQNAAEVLFLNYGESGLILNKNLRFFKWNRTCRQKLKKMIFHSSELKGKKKKEKAAVCIQIAIN